MQKYLDLLQRLVGSAYNCFQRGLSIYLQCPGLKINEKENN